MGGTRPPGGNGGSATVIGTGDAYGGDGGPGGTVFCRYRGATAVWRRRHDRERQTPSAAGRRRRTGGLCWAMPVTAATAATVGTATVTGGAGGRGRDRRRNGQRRRRDGGTVGTLAWNNRRRRTAATAAAGGFHRDGEPAVREGGDIASTGRAHPTAAAAAWSPTTAPPPPAPKAGKWRQRRNRWPGRRPGRRRRRRRRGVHRHAQQRRQRRNGRQWRHRRVHRQSGEPTANDPSTTRVEPVTGRGTPRRPEGPTDTVVGQDVVTGR